MLDYKNYEVKDFIADESFQQWTLQDEASDKLFWENWLDENPGKADIIERAQYLLLTKRDIWGNIEETEIQEETINLVNRIRQEAPPAKNKVIPFIQATWFRIAASIIITFGLGTLLYVNQSTFFLNELNIAGNTTEVLMKCVTATNKSMLITLPDGSSVILHKRSSISYPEQFSNDKREVILSGEGFFEVTKNAARPFLIYTNGLTTKVLGTSFTISAYENDKQVKVIVKTGKVMVFANVKEDKTKSNNKNITKEELVVLPNQQMLFDKLESSILISQVIGASVSHKTIAQTHSFEFRRKPVYEAFNELEKFYGIKISVDTANIKNRQITALLTDEPFGNKLDIICEAIDARYEQQSELVKIYQK